MGNKLADEWLDERGFPPGMQVFSTSTTMQYDGYWPQACHHIVFEDRPYTWRCWYCGSWHGYLMAQDYCGNCGAPRREA